ncbi:sugar ABC transporter ATP-binding protein [Anaerolentibacter hominis]|uniref:sugar ABC transporter ATP-binding protein n=1 Tax=Anaerolentibacter hominis TaxID=3079009 RepID=UPI0031B81F74
MQAGTENDYKLQLSHITKVFPGVKALDDVTINVRRGKVHSIVGENGAGKSTMMKILDGIYHADGGEVLIDGKEVEIRNPKMAASLGIAMIHQELAFCPNMTIEENFVLNKQPLIKGTRFIDWKRVTRETKAILEEEGIPYSPKTLLKDISISDIQLLEIIKATSANAQIIIMDEPTSSLTQHETARLFDKIRALREKGYTILYISHKMDEIFELSDDITVMRDGRSVKTMRADEVTRDELISLMVGRTISDVYPTRESKIGDIYFEAKNLSCGKLYQDISFNVRQGEIVGLAGLVGAGRTEIVRAISGLDPCDSGEVYINGSKIDFSSVSRAIDNGIMMVTEDRRKYGFAPLASIKDNIVVASLKRCSRWGFVQDKKMDQEVVYYFDRMRIKAPGMDTQLYALSGGNQQKVVFAKWLMAGPRLLILDEPTRGIDIGAKYEIYKIMNELIEEGISIIMISSELPELLGMCDRIYVVCEGRIQGEVARDEFNQEVIMNYATGGE